MAPCIASTPGLPHVTLKESATVRLFLILSALLCSVNNVHMDLKTATWLLYILSATSLTLAP